MSETKNVWIGKPYLRKRINEMLTINKEEYEEIQDEIYRSHLEGENEAYKNVLEWLKENTIEDESEYDGYHI